jgi:hypothetical protein
MRGNGHDTDSPLVRGRSWVRSPPTAPFILAKSIDFQALGKADRANARRTMPERADTYGTFASQPVPRPFPWSVFLTCIVIGLIAGAFGKAAFPAIATEEGRAHA